jgi:ribose transport system ATP-binding protein
MDYPGVRALDSVTLDFRSGEIHAVVGENGAGKSTLMKVLSGAIAPTSGEVLLDAQPMVFARPADALRAGIAMVHQELNLVGTLSIAENILLGREPRRGLGIDRRAMRQLAMESLNALGSTLDPQREARDLSIAEAQYVEIAKCLARDARVLIFDEPTAVLSEREAAVLLRLLQSLRDEGRIIIFISHHLNEVVRVADRVAVLRDGRVVQQYSRTPAGLDADESELARAMIGRSLGDVFPPKQPVASSLRPRLELEGFGALGTTSGIDLEVRPGEIVGVAGLVGCGRTETAEAIAGLRTAQGVLQIDGKAIRFRNAREALRAGVVYVSEDRKGCGLHLTLSSIANTTLPSLRSYGSFWLDSARERATTERWIQSFGIRCPAPASAISNLSGGNQQKFALARWLETKPRVLVVDEPTRGVDVGAKAEIYRILVDLAAQGLACIIISSELPEIIGLAHRVLVLRAGRPVAWVPHERLTEERLVRLASGLSDE